MKKILSYSIFGILLSLYSCGSKHMISWQGDYGPEFHEAGFFLGLFGGLLWPVTLIFVIINWLLPGWGCSAMYYHFNTGFGYWLGYIIGLIPYLGVLFGSKKSK